LYQIMSSPFCMSLTSAKLYQMQRVYILLLTQKKALLSQLMALYASHKMEPL